MLTRRMDGQTARGDHLRLLGGLSSITTLTLALNSDEKQSHVYCTSATTHVYMYNSAQIVKLQGCKGLMA